MTSKIQLPSPLPPPPIADYSAEGEFIRFFNEAIALATLLNDNMAAVFSHRCEFWLENCVRYQANKIQVPPKPEPPVGYTIQVVTIPAGTDGSSGEYSVPQARLSDQPVADPCPDPPVDNVKIMPVPDDPVGEWFGGADQWYRVKQGDQSPIGSTFVSNRGSFVRSQIPGPFGAFQYWAKIA